MEADGTSLTVEHRRHHRYFLRPRSAPSTHHSNATIPSSRSVPSSAAPHSSCSNKSRILFQFAYRAIFVLIHFSLSCLVFIPSAFAILLYNLCIKLFTRFSHSISTFFYGSELTTSSSESRQATTDTLDPLTDIIRRFPSHAAWFIKATMLFGAFSGILLSAPIGYYLHHNWSFCSVCPKPLRWWLLFNCCLQAVQVPLRLCFSRCINVLLHLTTPSASQRHLQGSQQQSQTDSAADSDEMRQATVPNPARHLNTIPTNGLRAHGRDRAPTMGASPFNFISARRTARRRRRHELILLSQRLIRLTNSNAWRFSVWLSIAAYAWFLIGVIWIFSAKSSIRCCCNSPSGRCPPILQSDPEDPLDMSTSDDQYISTVKPDIRLLTIIVLIVSMTRLVVVLILFFLSLPSRLFSDFPPRILLRRDSNNASDIALLHLREAFATFDRTPSLVNHYWNSQPHRQYQQPTTENTSNTDEESDTTDLELRPYLFRTFNGDPEDDIESLSSDDQTDNIVNGRRPTESRRRRGLPFSAINQLPLMYHSKLVFPRALRSRDSLARALARSNTTSREGVTPNTGNRGRDGVPSRVASNDHIAVEHPFGTTNNPIVLDHDDGMSTSSSLPWICSSTTGSPSSRQQSRRGQRSPSSLLCSFLPRLMKQRDTEFFSNGETTADVGRRHLGPTRTIHHDEHLGGEPRLSHRRTSSATLLNDRSPKSPSSSFLPSWKRLKVCFGSTRQVRHCHQSPSSSTTEHPPVDFTSELFVGPPLFLASCSICLDDFEENCEIRQLPCRHGFHRPCIDTWLTQVDSCPLCHIPTFSSNTFTLPQHRRSRNHV